MKKGIKVLNSLVLSSILLTPVVCNAQKAPDGKTTASGSQYETWKNNFINNHENWEKVSMSPGKNESEMNFAWYSKNGETTWFKYGEKADLSDAKSVNINSNNVYDTYKSNKVTVSNLKAGKKYYYQIKGHEIASFTTDDDSSKFSFALVGDPQIGASNEVYLQKDNLDEYVKAQMNAVANDSYNWNNTVNNIMKHQDLRFIVSAGDQINTAKKYGGTDTTNEIEYNGYLSAEGLKNMPVATTVGNHDADTNGYLGHFNPANLSNLGSNGISGGDYSFKYGKALFMVLNTQKTNTAEHEKFINETVKNNSDCTWKIVVLHQDIYGSAEHSNEPDIINLRYELVPILEKNKIDVVLTGHDHAYTRSKMLKGGQQELSMNEDEFEELHDKDVDVKGDTSKRFIEKQNIKDNTTDPKEQSYLKYLRSVMDDEAIEKMNEGKEIVTNSNGILYMTAGSSSGSKFYDLVSRQQSYVANRWQEDIPTYSVVNVDETSFTINTYRTDNNAKIDSQFMLVKSVDHSKLTELINKIEKEDLSKYTNDSVANLNKVLASAKNINANSKATTDELTNAYTALKETYDNLKIKKTDNNVNNTNKKDEIVQNKTNTTDKNVNPVKNDMKKQTIDKQNVEAINKDAGNNETANNNSGVIEDIVSTFDNSNVLGYAIACIAAFIVIIYKFVVKFKKK